MMIRAYLPEGEGAKPVVLFSHGLGGSHKGNAYLGNAWAESGFVSVFLQHPGSDAEVWKHVPRLQRMQALRDAASLEQALARMRDVPFVIDWLESQVADTSSPFYEQLDLEHIGLSGHSFGAATSQAMAGQKTPRGKSFGDERIDAFILMSPSASKWGKGTEVFSNFTKPMLFMTGELDGSPIDAGLDPASRQEVFHDSPDGDKFQLVFSDAEHLAFSDSAWRDDARNPRHHPAIVSLTELFWKAYLLDDASAKAVLQSSEISDAHLEEGDTWEWK